MNVVNMEKKLENKIYEASNILVESFINELKEDINITTTDYIIAVDYLKKSIMQELDRQLALRIFGLVIR